jgi:hypothetical protein
MTGNQPQSGRPGSQTDDHNRQQQAVQHDPATGGKRPTGGDQGKVGLDTDGDGKVVRPGQQPGQSHGKGMPDKR